MGQNCFYEDGVCFECQRCSACCRYEPGNVFLSNREVDTISNFLHLDRAFFIRNYCSRVFAHGGLRLSLIEKSNYDCIFWNPDTKGCSIYPVRPVQCSTFPFWPSIFASKEVWDLYAKDCPGMNRGAHHTKDEIEAKIKEYEDELES